MRRSCLSVFSLLLLALAACEKPITSDETPDTPEQLNGNFIVSVAKEGLTTTRLNFALYDMSGTRVKQVNQQAGNDGFGTASFQVDNGDYFMVIVAHSSNGNPTMANPKKIQFTNTQGFTDTFLYSGNVTVGDGQKDISVTLRRIVSLCRFVLTDDYPAEVTKMRFYYTGGSGAFDATTGFGCVNSKQSVSFDVASNQKAFDLYTFLHGTEGTIHLLVTAYDANDNVLCEREFDVPLSQNRITTLTGSFFSDSSSAVSTITINTDWEGEYHLTF